MTRVTMLGRLTAAEDRTLKGVLLPFGVPGLTNLGKVTASKGTLTVPDDMASLHASLDHLDDRDDVAAFEAVEESDEGLMAQWEVPKTHGGDRLLAEFRAGVRTGVSVEIEPVQIKAGQIVSGTVIGCAFPVEPAFPTARLVAELAPDTEDDEDENEDTETTDEAPAESAPPAAPAAEDPTEDQEDPEMGDTKTASAPADLRASKASGPEIKKPADLFRLMAEAYAQTSPRARQRLLAALSDIVPSNVADMSQPQWVGELWSGVGYQRRYTGLINQGPLTGLNLEGWRWVTKPEMAVYGGNKAPVPSNSVDTEPVTKAATRFAGAHDVDRAMVDFPNPGFWASYYAAMAESYARLTDAHVVSELKAGATAFTPGTVPSGVPAGWVAVLDGALQIVDIGLPTFALVEKSVYRDMFLTGQDKFLEFLNASMGLTEGTLNTQNFRILPVASTGVGDASSANGLDTGEVLVGARQAATFYELGGGAPIRVEAVDLVNGGVDAGCFGYGGVIIHEADALVIADLTADV